MTGLVRFICFLLMAMAPAVAAAQPDFPTRAIRIIVPYPPGASTDIITRVLAEQVSSLLGHPVIVENKPGAGAIIGTQAAKAAPSDGYTLLFQAGSYVTNLYTVKNPGYSLDDFVPVVGLADTAFVMLMSSKVPARSLEEFVAYAKANPGKLNYGVLGRGAGPFVLSARLARLAGLDWTDIGYKGTTEAARAVLAGEIEAYFSTQAYASTQAESPRLKLLAITSDRRADLLPNVPTFRELGYPEMTEKTWYALLVRAETPGPILDKLRTVFAEATKSALVQQQLKSNGLLPYDGAIGDFSSKLRVEYERFVREAKQYGIQAQ